MNKTYILTGIIFLLISGCYSNKKSAGDLMLEQADNTHHLGEQYKKGDKLIKEGHALQQSGQKLLKKSAQLEKKGADQLHKGKVMAQEGEKLIFDSKDTFKAQFPDVPLEQK